MKPIDFRNETFRDIQARVEGDRAEILNFLRAHGPLTTRALAEQMPRDILAVRPRVTELVQLGAVEICGAQGHEGIYRALLLGEWMEAVRSRKERETCGEQMQLL
jgi:hypothetical protein